MSFSVPLTNYLPSEVELLEGRVYYWCTCGLSAKQPFCDGTHKDSGTGLKPLAFRSDSTKRALLCCCKQTRTPPYCEGDCEESHNNGQTPS